jgi:hypothetical protein
MEGHRKNWKQKRKRSWKQKRVGMAFTFNNPRKWKLL